MKELDRPSFYWIPEVVAAQVQPHESFVFSVVYWFTKLKDGCCYASNQRIADALPYKSSPLSVANALQVLEQHGFIKRVFKDEAKRIRSEIITLVDVTRVSPTGVTVESGGINPQVIGVSPTDDTGYHPQVNRIRKGNKKTEEEYSEHSSQIPEIIKLFEKVDPKNKGYYGNKTQRAACSFLLAEYGLPEVVKRIEVLPRTNGLPYFPTITTPLQLKDKWVTLENQVKRYRAEKEEKKNIVAF